MIEDLLKELVSESGVVAVLILKANEGYSAVPVTQEEYKEHFLLNDHWNDDTVLEAIEDMRRDMKGE